jgi:hypothetical protein
MHKWLRTASRTGAPVAFGKFESVIAKLRHEFIVIPEGIGLLPVCNPILAKRPAFVSIWQKIKNFFRPYGTVEPL